MTKKNYNLDKIKFLKRKPRRMFSRRKIAKIKRTGYQLWKEFGTKGNIT